MKFLKIMSTTMLLSLILGGNAVASERFPKPIVLADNVDDSTYHTKWTAYPLREQFGSKKIAIYADGKASAFEGIVDIYCDEPKESHIVATWKHYSIYNEMSFKDAMAESVIPRTVVNNIFSKFCN